MKIVGFFRFFSYASPLLTHAQMVCISCWHTKLELSFSTLPTSAPPFLSSASSTASLRPLYPFLRFPSNSEKQLTINDKNKKTKKLGRTDEKIERHVKVNDELTC